MSHLSFTIMDNVTKIAAKNLHDFFRPYKKHLSKPTGRKIFSYMKGMIEGRTVQMCEAGRHAEAKIKPKTFCTKIFSLLDEIQWLEEIHIQKFIKMKWKYFIIDESDIQRTYANKLKGIQKVRDGSIGKNDSQGYPLIAVIGVTDKGEYIPLILRRYDDIQSARFECVDKIINIFGPDHGAIWILDRGFDDKKFIAKLLNETQEFIIRIKRGGGQRHMEVRSAETEQRSISELTAHMEKVGYRRVYMPNHDEQLTLIHYDDGQRKEPWTLLTTISPKTLKQAESIALIYLKRWTIEDYIFFIKQSFKLEDLMIQLPEHVDGLLAIVLMTSHFVMRETFRMTDSLLNPAFEQWSKKEDTELCWSSVCRFYRKQLESWTLINHNKLRTCCNSLNWLQPRLIPI